MYAAHQGGQGLRTIFSSPSVNYDRDGKPGSFWGLKGSASLQIRTWFSPVVNPHVSEARETELAVRGATIKSGTVTTLTHSDIHAHTYLRAKKRCHSSGKRFGSGRTFAECDFSAGFRHQAGIDAGLAGIQLPFLAIFAVYRGKELPKDAKKVSKRSGGYCLVVADGANPVDPRNTRFVLTTYSVPWVTVFRDPLPQAEH